jgi:hypothetical protein
VSIIYNVFVLRNKTKNNQLYIDYTVSHSKRKHVDFNHTIAD